jgi:hypothetical protein
VTAVRAPKAVRKKPAFFPNTRDNTSGARPFFRIERIPMICRPNIEQPQSFSGEARNGGTGAFSENAWHEK